MRTDRMARLRMASRRARATSWRTRAEHWTRPAPPAFASVLSGSAFHPTIGNARPNSPIFSNARKNGIFKLGEWGTQVHPDLGQQPTDFDIVKHRVSPFHGTNLEVILRTHGVRRIYCSGISTNAVVQAAVREGHDRDYEMVLLEDCCCALSAEEHESAIKLLQRFCKVTTSKDVAFE